MRVWIGIAAMIAGLIVLTFWPNYPVGVAGLVAAVIAFVALRAPLNDFVRERRAQGRKSYLRYAWIGSIALLPLVVWLTYIAVQANSPSWRGCAALIVLDMVAMERLQAWSSER